MVEARPFLEAVDASEVADYYEVIKVPLAFLRRASQVGYSLYASGLAELSFGSALL